MTYFRTLTIRELCEKLCERKATLIVYHARPDADAICSAFALRELLEAMDIPTICACVDEIPDRLGFLCDGVQGSVLADEEMEFGHDRVISVDSASPSQLGALFERLHRNIDLMIDHHGTGTVYADHYIDPAASATGEIMFEIAKELVAMGHVGVLNSRFYRFIYAAIASDTGGFRFANATPKTLRVAAELLEAGVDHTDLCRRLFESKSLQQIKAEGEAASRMRLYEKGRIAAVTFPYSSKFALGVRDEHLETIIDIPRSVAGVEIAFAVRQPEEKGVFRVSMRSATDFDVSAVCARFGGGGHRRAAGCTVEAQNVYDAEEKILSVVKDLLFF